MKAIVVTPHVFEFFRDPVTRRFYWRLRAPGGRIVAESYHSYAREGDARRAAAHIMAAQLVMPKDF